MISHLYRYRSTKQLIDGFHELEKQEIYCCPPSDLNDPIEGFKDLCWVGDQIVWKNLLKHYILCLLHIALPCFGGEKNCLRALLRNLAFTIPDELPAIPLRSIYARASEAFVNEDGARKFVDLMAARTAPVRRNELTNYLRALHPFALKIVFKEFTKNGLALAPNFAAAPDPEQYRRNAIKMMESASQIPLMESYAEHAAEAFFAANEAMVMQLDLIAEYQTADRPASRPITFFCRYFPAAYVAAIEGLVHPEWYVACFSANPINASMWGSYGDGHRGVCLKFKTTPGSAGAPSLNINCVTGLSGTRDSCEYHRSFVPIEFRRVEYAPAFPPIDFFRSLGRVRTINLNHFWYRGENNNFSKCRVPLPTGENVWREQYWKTFSAGSLYKTSEWKREEEYRLILYSSGFDLREKAMRTLRYRFEDLAGIVFGARTDVEDKLAIMRIVDDKCAMARRSDFEFHEVRYAAGASSFHLVPLSLLKIRYE